VTGDKNGFLASAITKATRFVSTRESAGQFVPLCRDKPGCKRYASAFCFSNPSYAG
jgi:hypothetical protein